MPLIDTAGPVAEANRDLMFIALGLMAVVVIPVFILTALVLLRYRAGHEHGKYRPEWNFSGWLEALIWGIPALIIVALGVFLWNGTHRLDPYSPLPASSPPLEVQVIGLDWKWLFLYPEQQIASVDRLVFPADRPIALSLTTDANMMSFFIPRLGSQIYAMAGMETKLHLAADGNGTFLGRNTQFNGIGFSRQHFDAMAVGEDDFAAFVDKAKAREPLSSARYRQLALPSVLEEPEIYGGYPGDHFRQVMMKYKNEVPTPDRPDENALSTEDDIGSVDGSGHPAFSVEEEAPVDRGDGPITVSGPQKGRKIEPDVEEASE
ncbi:ubiquinol oxidase subunit II [Notoacmeibacter ruber]|uniref:Cytochrome ubiquinol oxidase subunit II n=1 Tax=Notoacmeibacter ruber TaxID=2670375 RepID=A0A3L7JCJ2_9HYPH|nr:ubiquinol oxidase subunit II [Notoacmeibacter ruber]RLQ88383.1 cytochrome ubiquinol oxidase subunit II [Notoacmeibacter ruber]